MKGDNLESVTGIYSYSMNPLPAPRTAEYRVGEGCPDSEKINMMRKEEYMKKDSKRIGNYMKK